MSFDYSIHCDRCGALIKENIPETDVIALGENTEGEDLCKECRKKVEEEKAKGE